MTQPSPIRYVSAARYDRDRGVALALDWRAYPAQTLFAEHTDAELVAQAIQSGVAIEWSAPYLAGYGLALAARAWAGRPSEARRGAVIQAGERLRAARPGDWRLARLLEQALAHADAAILAGADAEAAIADFVDAEARSADRAAERCARVAAGLLDTEDRVLAHGFAGPALPWMLVYSAKEGKRADLIVAAAENQPELAQLAQRVASAIGAQVALLDTPVGDDSFERERISVFVVGAARVALDGGVACERGAGRLSELARASGVPLYVLAPDGPDPECASTAALSSLAEGEGPPNPSDVIAPDLISAIITSRGIYRPEMIARYLDDGDAPLDVIPLS